MNSYRHRVATLLRPLLEKSSPVRRALDFGAGDGWFAATFEKEGLVDEIVAVDVLPRRWSHADVFQYDGRRLPFQDREFDVSYSVDVLHHCASPRDSLLELLRCTAKYLLLKDHTYESWAGWLTLCALDEIGNRRFGVPSIHKYQHRWEWLPWFEEQGFVLETLVFPAACHTGVLGRATNSLQFVALWRRA